MVKKFDYLSDKTVKSQEEYLNDFIIKINKNINNGTIEVRGKDVVDKNERALTTDTHGDIMSIMGAVVMCGVKFKENEFLYYDRKEGIYYEKVDGKYYKYIPPYTEEKRQGKPIDKIAKDNSITVVPIPDISNARDLYHLGDVLDRGQESLTSLLLCEVCPNIKLVQGNHEFDRDMNEQYGYEKEISSIHLILARMKHNGRINTVYYDGKDNDVISYSHIPLTENHVIGFFNFLNSVYMTQKYSKENPPLIKFLNKEFKKQLGLGYKYLFDKINNFLKNNRLNYEDIKNFNNIFNIIGNNFTKEEMLIIKNIIAGALIERQFKVEKNGKINFINNNKYFSEVYDNFNELSCGTIINSNRNYKNGVISSNVVGHTPKENEIVIKENGKYLFIDDEKSASFKKEGKNEKKSCATVTYINIKVGKVIHSSFSVERKEKGEEVVVGRILRKDNSITDNFQKNKTGHEMLLLNNFKLPENIITNSKPDLENIDIIKINNYIYNIFEQDNINFESFENLFAYLDDDEVLYYKTTEIIFNKAYEEKKYEIIENLLNNYFDKIFNGNFTSEEFINNFLIMFDFICSDQNKNKQLPEKLIEIIANKEEDIIPKFLVLINKRNSVSNITNKLLESGIIERSLDTYAGEINNFNISSEFIDISNFILNNQNKFPKLSEKLIKNISDMDETKIFNIFNLLYDNNFFDMIDKLLADEDLKNKLIQNKIVGRLIFNALNTGNINMTKVLIKHGFKFDTVKLTRKKEEFKTFEETFRILVADCNIKKEKFKKINFSLGKKNIFKYKTIEEEEFERLNNVLDLIEEQIKIESNNNIYSYIE